MECDICGMPAFATINGMRFCLDHQSDALRLQLHIAAMEHGAPIDLVERLGTRALHELAERMNRD